MSTPARTVKRPLGKREGYMPSDPSTEGSERQRPPRSARFAQEIEKICGADPGARNALRKGLRRGLDDRQVRVMHRIVSPWFPRDRYVPEAEERAYYAVAAMIADAPRYAFADNDEDEGKGPAETAAGSETTDEDSAADSTKPEAVSPRRGVSLGLSLALAVDAASQRERSMRASTAERRLDLLTRQSTAGLHRHLPASVRYVRQTGVEIDWAQLLDDLIAWPRHHGRISRRWLQDYHRHLLADPMKRAEENDRQQALEETTES